MYDLIEKLIGHQWANQYAGDQQLIYYIVGTLICLLTVTFIDIIYRLIRSVLRKGDF